MNKNIAFSIGGFVALALLALASVVALTPARDAHANVFTATNIQAATTTISVSVTSSTRIMATTSNPLDPSASYSRVYATICNPNANPVFLSLNFDKPATLASSTFVIASAAGFQSCYEITDRNQYNGSITASSSNQTATTIFGSQYVQ